MKLVTFSLPGRAGGSHQVGVLDGDQIASLTEAGLAATMMDVVRGAQARLKAIRDGLPRAPRHALRDARLHAPINSGKVLCSGINYRAHATENPNAKMPEEPFFFAKLPSSVVGPDTPVARHPRVTQMDYEVEFSAVIGAPLHQATEADVIPAIFGYTLLNDLSARDVQFKDAQITLGKNFAGYAPIGPCITTADALDPNNVRLSTHVNGVQLQDGHTSDWLFPLPRLISFLSGVMPLEPGDIVTTGTPAGVGVFRNPQVFLKPGDVVEIAAEGIGSLRTPIIAG
jgi:2-keto-4-pentenoate hydratase/2-oxohepta-3-ene-1,7-dioic acid hydratase in catechol pathway